MLISPSMLSADFKNLEKELESIKNADYIHLDVMDGKFVPNITFGPLVIKHIRSCTKTLFDTHLMIDEPINYIKEFAKAGSDLITFHIEATNKIQETIDEIKKYNKKVGISMKPNTPLESIIPFIEQIDLVLVMSVEPGFGGQKFIRNSLDKVSKLNKLRNDKNLDFLINVDGGVNNINIKELKANGCDIAVLGSFIFKQEDRIKTIKELRECL